MPPPSGRGAGKEDRGFPYGSSPSASSYGGGSSASYGSSGRGPAFDFAGRGGGGGGGGNDQGDINYAVNFVAKVKQRFIRDPDKHKLFLQVLHDYEENQTTTGALMATVSKLFADHPDLLKEFTFFLRPMPQGGDSLNFPGERLPYGGGGGGPQGGFNPVTGEPDMNVAVNFLNKVNQRFAHEREKYQYFLDLLHEYEKGKISPESVTKSVNSLLAGHPDLCREFAFFLPVQDRRHALAAAQAQQGSPSLPLHGGDNLGVPGFVGTKDVNFAMVFVQKVKQRFSHEPDKYTLFLNALQEYEKNPNWPNTIIDVANQLFGNHPDLLRDFSFFLPRQVLSQGPPGEGQESGPSIGHSTGSPTNSSNANHAKKPSGTTTAFSPTESYSSSSSTASANSKNAKPSSPPDPPSSGKLSPPTGTFRPKLKPLDHSKEDEIKEEKREPKKPAGDDLPKPKKEEVEEGEVDEREQETEKVKGEIEKDEKEKEKEKKPPSPVPEKKESSPVPSRKSPPPPSAMSSIKPPFPAIPLSKSPPPKPGAPFTKSPTPPKSSPPMKSSSPSIPDSSTSTKPAIASSQFRSSPVPTSSSPRPPSRTGGEKTPPKPEKDEEEKGQEGEVMEEELEEGEVKEKEEEAVQEDVMDEEGLAAGDVDREEALAGTSERGEEGEALEEGEVRQAEVEQEMVAMEEEDKRVEYPPQPQRRPLEADEAEEEGNQGKAKKRRLEEGEVEEEVPMSTIDKKVDESKASSHQPSQVGPSERRNGPDAFIRPSSSPSRLFKVNNGVEAGRLPQDGANRPPGGGRGGGLLGASSGQTTSSSGESNSRYVELDALFV